MTAVDVLTTASLAGVDPVPWARSQMAFTLAFHIILVPLGVSWALMALVANYAGFLAPKVALVSNIVLMIAVLLWRPAGLYTKGRH